MKKRLLALMLSLAILFGGITPAFASGYKGGNEKIQWLINKSWVVGREPEGYELDKTIQRSEITKMVIISQGEEKAAQTKKERQSSFSDVEKEYWANGFINQASDQKYVIGYEDGTFKPTAPIRYNEVLAILCRLHPNFTEKKVENGSWDQYYIEFAKENKILQGVNIPNGDYTQNALREQAFEMIYNLYHSPKDSGEKKIVDYGPSLVQDFGFKSLKIQKL